MNIPGRRKKVESDKLIKEITMYIYLVKNNKVSDQDLNVISPTFKRSMQRYANELYHCGATPKMRLKSDENSLFYSINVDLLKDYKRFYAFEDSAHTNRLARVITLAYLSESKHPFMSNKAKLEEFYFKYLNTNASTKTLYRDLKLLKLAYSYIK